MFLTLTTGSLDRIVVAHHGAYVCRDPYSMTYLVIRSNERTKLVQTAMVLVYIQQTTGHNFDTDTSLSAWRFLWISSVLSEILPGSTPRYTNTASSYGLDNKLLSNYPGNGSQWRRPTINHTKTSHSFRLSFGPYIHIFDIFQILSKSFIYQLMHNRVALK